MKFCQLGFSKFSSGLVTHNQGSYVAVLAGPLKLLLMFVQKIVDFRSKGRPLSGYCGFAAGPATGQIFFGGTQTTIGLAQK